MRSHRISMPIEAVADEVDLVRLQIRSELDETLAANGMSGNRPAWTMTSSGLTFDGLFGSARAHALEVNQTWAEAGSLRSALSSLRHLLTDRAVPAYFAMHGRHRR